MSVNPAHSAWIDTFEAGQIFFLLFNGAQQLTVFRFEASDFAGHALINQLLDFWRDFDTTPTAALSAAFWCVKFQEHVSN